LESSFKKGRIAFTALSAVVDKERSSMVLLGVGDDREVPDIFIRPARDAQGLELIKEIANIMQLTITCRY